MRKLLAIFWLLIAVPALAQPSFYGRDFNQVYVRDSAVALEKFALAERLERLHEWSKAGDVYQDILSNYGDRVVSTTAADASANQVVQYTSVIPAVQERLARWPAEGLQSYRARYEAEAQGMLDAAKPGELAPLHKVFSSYFVTEAGKNAGMRLIDGALEAGDFAAAAWTAQRLLDVYPDLGADRPRLLYRAAVALHLNGDDAEAQKRLDQLKKESPDALGRVRGEDVRLVDSLASELRSPRPSISASAGDDESWPMIYGSADRARVARAVGSIGANLFNTEVARPETSINRAAQLQMEPQTEAARKEGQMTGIYPVVDRGELFFQDNSRIYALSLESGLPLPGWAQRYDGEASGRYVAPGTYPTPRNQHYAVTVTDDSVLAILGQSDTMTMTMTGNWSMHDTRLVCLDRRSGAERWVVRPRQLGESLPALKDLDFSGSPLVVGDSLYVIARGGKGMQFEDCYVLCLDADGGKFKWACYVASANVPGDMFNPDPVANSGQDVSHLSYASGRLYCLTNLGALAAINAYDGTIVWLDLYEREKMDMTRMNWAMRGRTWNTRQREKPWEQNPVIVSDGKLFALPSDGLNVHVFDAGNGRELKRIALKDLIVRTGGSSSSPQTMLGVVGDRLILCNADRVFCLNWRAYDAKKPLINNVFWYSNNFNKAGNSMAIAGRGMVTTDSIFVPLAWQLVRLDLKQGLVIGSYPKEEWGANEGPGNVLATSEHLIIAGPTRVSVYTDLNMAMKKLDAAVAAAPQDPEPRLRYAEVMFISNQLDTALGKLDEAIELLGGRKAMAPGMGRDRVFADAVTFAQKLAKNPAANGEVERIRGLFDRAGDAALSAAQQVNLRLSRADYARSVKDSASELKLYQEILLQPTWRSVPVARAEAGGARQAGLVAKDAIEEVLRRPEGRDLYQPYEQAATTAVDAARPAANPTALLEVAQAYPNSAAARQALLLTAEAYEASGNPRGAVQALRQLYFRNTSSPDRLKMIEGMARNYLAMSNRLDVAAARLAQGAKMSPDAKLSRPMRLPDGNVLKDVSFKDALAAVRKLQLNATARSLPELHLPAYPADQKRIPEPFKPARDSVVIDGVATLLTPPRDFARLDRVVTFTPGAGLSIYAVGSPTPLFRSLALDSTPRGIAWTGGNLLAWNETKLVMLDGEAGNIVWQIAPRALPAVELVSLSGNANGAGGADEDPDAAAANDADGDGIPDAAADANVLNGVQIQQLGNGQAVIVQQRNLRLQRVRVLGRGNFVIGPRGAVQVAVGGAGAGPGAAVANAGAAAGAANPDPNNGNAETITAVQPLSDRAILATSGGRLVAADLTDGKLLWQARPAKAPVEKLLGSDDFVVAKLTGNSSSLIAAVDAFSGNTVFRKAFARDPGGTPNPVNLALSSDGTLVWLMPDRAVAKDLFESGDSLRFGGNPRPGEQNFAYALSSGEDQLVIADGRILVVAENGMFIEALSMDTGQMLQNEDDHTPLRFATGLPNSDARPAIRVVGSMMYVVTPLRVVAYDLDHLGNMWQTQSADPGVQVRTPIRAAMPCRDYLLLVTDREATRGRDAKPAGFVLGLHSRARLADGTESGNLQFRYELEESVGIAAWQAVDGGVYYLAGDQKLHFLAGAGGK